MQLYRKEGKFIVVEEERSVCVVCL
jgi:hypothetical protein